ncbi:XRE family transcriptional regulator [Streptomyces specialis]|uniref:XRE family transcriptional regulator n=1 Tax=Streptomyces specialis TaxID=498367 RepID=UPI000B07D4DF|nr:XRE family transcriptional regulator [Streptomyces specialis]
MLSGWERGRHTTSIRYRTLLSHYYSQPPDVLFAHQDLPLTAAGQAPTLLAGHRELRQAMVAVVRGAQQYLAITGSRSRDATYLQTIETVLAERPELIHYRILFGPPRHAELTAHLARLLALRDPGDRSLGLKTLHLGVIPADRDTPERFFVASENAAVAPIPSLTSAYAFDSGVLLAPHAAGRLSDPARQCYAAAQRIETPHALTRLASSLPGQRKQDTP